MWGGQAGRTGRDRKRLSFMTFLSISRPSALHGVRCFPAVLESVIVDQICEQDAVAAAAAAIPPNLPPVEFQPQTPGLPEVPEEEGRQVICCDPVRSVRCLEFAACEGLLLFPAQTNAHPDDRDRPVIPEVAFASPAAGQPPGPWLTSTAGVQTPAPPPPAAPTPAGKRSLSPGRLTWSPGWLMDTPLSQVRKYGVEVGELSPFCLQVCGATSLWTRDPAGSMWYAGTTTPRPTLVPSSGSGVVRATPTSLNLKPTVNIPAWSRNGTEGVWVA